MENRQLSYGKILHDFMMETGHYLPGYGNAHHPEYRDCVEIAQDGKSWAYVGNRELARINALDAEADEWSLWQGTYRGKSKPGRVLRSLYLAAGLPEPTGPEVDTIIRAWNVFITPPVEYEPKIFQGDNIKWAYYEKNTCPGTGNINGSCMRHKDCQDYLDIYSTNPQVKVFVLMKDGLIHARALIWMDKYHDRLYGTTNHTYDLLRETLTDRGYIDAYEMRSNGHALDMPLDNSYFSQYPYMDSFPYVDRAHNTVYTYQPTDGDRSELVYCQNLDGGFHYVTPKRKPRPPRTLIECTACDDTIDETDACYIDGDPYCNECAVYSEYDDEYYLTEDTVYSEIENSYLYTDDATFCRWEDEYCHRDHAVMLYDGTWTHENEALEMFDGDYCHAGQEHGIIDRGEYEGAAYVEANIDMIVELWDGEICHQDDTYIELTTGAHQGEYAMEEDTTETWDGAIALTDETVETYNGLIALKEECLEMEPGTYALPIDPIIITTPRGEKPCMQTLNA